MKRRVQGPGWSARALLGVAALWLAGGCASVEGLGDPAARGPFFEPVNHTGRSRLPDSIRRVVLLPAAGVPGVPTETLASFNPVLLAALQQSGRFEVVVADRPALWRLFGIRAVLSTDALPSEFLSMLAREYGADAVMFIDITAFSPYPPLTVGLRAKLATTTDSAILWAFDTLFSAQDPAVANAARRYDRRQHPAMEPGDAGYTVLRSPAHFAAYAAEAAFATLPPR
ncbi:MAG: hypothetical protein PHE83_04005 [Opitutaceae bacterium]|nr:hypothetical protein [Opitutaceae bacterium]